MFGLPLFGWLFCIALLFCLIPWRRFQEPKVEEVPEAGSRGQCPQEPKSSFPHEGLIAGAVFTCIITGMLCFFGTASDYSEYVKEYTQYNTKSQEEQILKVQFQDVITALKDQYGDDFYKHEKDLYSMMSAGSGKLISLYPNPKGIVIATELMNRYQQLRELVTANRMAKLENLRVMQRIKMAKFVTVLWIFPAIPEDDLSTLGLSVPSKAPS